MYCLFLKACNFKFECREDYLLTKLAVAVLWNIGPLSLFYETRFARRRVSIPQYGSYARWVREILLNYMAVSRKDWKYQIYEYIWLK